jgi:hypothetical protein
VWRHIKIVSEGPPSRGALRRLRESITGELLKSGFTFDPNNPDQVKSNYESRYTLYRLPYNPIGAGQGSLRPEISRYPQKRQWQRFRSCLGSVGTAVV